MTQVECRRCEIKTAFSQFQSDATDFSEVHILNTQCIDTNVIFYAHFIYAVRHSTNAKSCRNLPGRRQVYRFQRKVESTLQSHRGPAVVGPHTDILSAGSPLGSAG